MRLLSVLGETCSLPGPREARSYRSVSRPKSLRRAWRPHTFQTGGPFPGSPEGQARCYLQAVPLWRTERGLFLVVVVVPFPSNRGLSRDFVPAWADLSFDSDSDQVGPATVRALRGQGLHWRLYRICSWDRGWDNGSFRLVCQGAGGAGRGWRGWECGRRRPAAGLCQPLGDWSPRPRNSGPESEMKLRWTHIPGPGRV